MNQAPIDAAALADAKAQGSLAQRMKQPTTANSFTSPELREAWQQGYDEAEHSATQKA